MSQWQTGLSAGIHNTFLTAPSNNEPIVFRDVNDVTSQIVNATALPGVTYTLDVEMGFDISHYDLGQIQLWVGGHEVVAGPTSIHDPRQLSGNWYNYEVNYTATAADIGDPIEIALSSLTGSAGPWAWFANVRLTELDPPRSLWARQEPRDRGRCCCSASAEWLALLLFAAHRDGEARSPDLA